MSDLRNQKRIAASVLKCGVNRVKLDSERSDDISNAISREDIRGLIDEGAISAKPVKGVSRGRARALTAKRSYGHRKGHGRRKGAQGARTPSKREWIKKIRAIRRELRVMRDEGQIDAHLYRIMYRKASGGQFRNVAHMKAQLEHISGRME
ncbi:50S ribosomal protein L19e [Methanoplanus limicola]|jgi:large subunit ribosomal protein L19e|uniref:Large ribosomal subunit protein eL19 n=1 Tax=Methanoplanus limicola DSM 2279 TaxID=937775 RepID=H1YWP8_9EURY|nr:50S ribosomal protein L19e [Methanoplanus limicola]EHQ36789.1 Ribosomal protein L19e [Methanoplanus limicola DSM 2279]